jgi:hypothetical protein
MTEENFEMTPELRILRGCNGCRYKYDLKSEKCEECQAYEQWEAEDDK